MYTVFAEVLAIHEFPRKDKEKYNLIKHVGRGGFEWKCKKCIFMMHFTLKTIQLQTMKNNQYICNNKATNLPTK